MGSRALIQVIKDDEFSPIIYLHWEGHRTKEIIEKAASAMSKGDVSYSFGRLCGVCHLETNPDQKLSFGVWNSQHILTKQDSHGDNGCFIIDIDSGEVTATDYGIESFMIELS